MFNKILKYLGLFLILFLLQTVFLPSFLPAYTIPDFCLILLAFISLRYGPAVGVFTGFSLGILQDVYSPGLLGISSLANSILAYLVGFFDEHHFSYTLTTKLILLSAAFLVRDLVFRMGVELPMKSVLWDISFTTLPVLIVTVACTALLLKVSAKNHLNH